MSTWSQDVGLPVRTCCSQVESCSQDSCRIFRRLRSMFKTGLYKQRSFSASVKRIPGYIGISNDRDDSDTAEFVTSAPRSWTSGHLWYFQLQFGCISHGNKPWASDGTMFGMQLAEKLGKSGKQQESDVSKKSWQQRLRQAQSSCKVLELVCCWEKA